MRPGRLRLQPRSLCGSLMVAIALTLPAVGTAIARTPHPYPKRLHSVHLRSALCMRTACLIRDI